MGQQNWLGSLALAVWPFLALALFTQLRPARAIIWSILGAQLLLPAGAFFKIGMVPQLDKVSLPNLSILLGCLLFARKPFRFFRRPGLVELLLACIILSPLFTSALNSDNIYAGTTVLPGVGLYDGASAVQLAFITVLPFIVGRQFLNQAHDSEELLRALVFAGAMYSIPLLFEIRMSPNLQYWIYGFAATDFVMTYRSGGYRPMVFMGHGLIAAFFMMTTVIAAAALWRARVRTQILPMSVATAYLGTVLFLCKSAGAAIYGVLLFPLIRFTNARLQMRVASILVCLALSYPVLRALDLFPTNTLVLAAELINKDRALSLKFRFDNEDKLLRRAFERPLFGWGRFGRNLVFDDVNGRNESVTDGLWVITFGQFGLTGFLGLFGLLSIPVFRGLKASKYTRSFRDATYLGAIGLVVATNIVELIPNSGLLPWTWLLCGALLGRSENIFKEAKSNQASTIPRVPSSPNSQLLQTV